MFFKVILSLGTLLFSSILVPAAPGDLDPTFGVGGKALIPVGKVSYDQGRSAALQTDGKIIIVGDSVGDGEYSNEAANLFVTRLNTDGSRDPSFGIGGSTVLRLRASVTVAAVVVQADGKIVVGGFILVESGSPATIRRTFVIARFLSNGVPDSSFGEAGVIKSLIDPGQSATLTALALQPDGKIVATGFSGIISPATPHSLLVVRYNTNGTLDSSFDGDGKLFVNVGSSGNRGNAVLIQPDGKLVVGGSLREATGTITDFLLVRLNSEGSFDNTFDGDGKLTTKITTSTSAVTALTLQSDGKIVAVGTSNLGTNRNIALARYGANGSLDGSFDMDGVVVTDVVDEIATSAAIQTDGRILVGGFATVAPLTPFHFLASRYNTDGSPDNTFDGDGRVITALTSVLDRANSLLLQPDGRIVLAGSSVDIPDADISLARYNSNGSLDNTFDGDGGVLLELGFANDRIYDTALQPDGKIIAVGYAYGDLITNPAIARYNANGSIDLSFGIQGSVVMPPDLNFTERYANSVAVQTDGKVIFSIESIFGMPYTVVRLHPDGSLDSSFGTGGFVTVAVGTDSDWAAGLELQPDGKIVLAGHSVSAGVTGPSLVRLNTNGTLDGGFGSGGKVFTTDPAISGSVASLVLQDDGKILISGSPVTGAPGGSSFFTSRYNSNGSIDSTFGGVGAVYTDMGTGDFGLVVRVQDDDKIVVAGRSDRSLGIVRYSPQGLLDSTFDGDGKVIATPPSTLHWIVEDMAIQWNGRLVLVGGEFGQSNLFTSPPHTAAIFRFNTHGSPDDTFGANGRIISPIGSHDSIFSSVDILSNGKILAGGTSSNGLNDDFTAVRYLGDAVSNRAPFDFDGDGKTDIGIFRPVGAFSEWWINQSGNGQTFALQFGASTDKIAPADFTGDGKADIAFFRPASGEWYILRSEDFSFFALPFGANGDIPVPADYDADGKADFAVFRPSSSTWFISQSSGAPTRIEQFGATGDQPVVSDYDGDGKADVGIFRSAATGAEWWINRSTAGILAIQFGASTDKAVQGDYTGDGKTDIAIWKPGSGEWFIVRSEDFSFYGFPFGANGDVIAPGDYDGDGKFDPTVFRPASATWFIARSTAGTQIVQFGANGDRPVPNAFVP